MSILMIGTVLAVLSLFYTNRLADVLRQKEQNDVTLWVAAMERVSSDAFGNYRTDPLISHIVSTQNNIPFIITDENLSLIMSNRIDEDVLADPERYRRKLDELTEENTPRTVRLMWTTGRSHIIFYGHSLTLQTLYIFPYIQIFIIVVFVMVIFMAFRSMKQNEQSRVWVGLAKETAHQLGTPTSSLLGWIEYLREQPVDQMAVDEMQKKLEGLDFDVVAGAESRGFIFGEGGIGVRGAIFQTIQTRLTACLAHAERYEVDVLGMSPFVQCHDPLDILGRMRCGHKLDDVGTMVPALLHQCLERLV